MLTELQIKQGIQRNYKKAEKSLSEQLFLRYRRLVPTSNSIRYIVSVPRSAKKYLLKFINISIPSNSNLDNFFFVAYNSKSIKYVSENLRRNRFGAKLGLWTSPGADKDTATAGDQKEYIGMLPLDIDLNGSDELIFDFRGAGLASLAYVDILISGKLTNRISSQGGYDAGY